MAENNIEVDLNNLGDVHLKYLKMYFSELCGAYAHHIGNIIEESKIQVPHVYVDCANGVGTFALRDAKPNLKFFLDVELLHCDYNSHEKLNFQCGADFVKVQQCAPKG